MFLCLFCIFLWFEPPHQKKKTLIFHYTGCSIGILIIVYYDPHITGQYNPLYPPNNQVFFIAPLSLWAFSVCALGALLLLAPVSPRSSDLETSHFLLEQRLAFLPGNANLDAWNGRPQIDKGRATKAARSSYLATPSCKAAQLNSCMCAINESKKLKFSQWLYMKSVSQRIRWVIY